MTEFNTWHSLRFSEDAVSVTNKTKFYDRLFEFRKTTKPSWAAVTGSWANSIGFVDGKLKFVSISAASTLKKRQAIDTKEGVLAACDKFLNDYVFTADGPASFKSGFHDAGRSWIWMVTQKDLVTGLFQGLALCFPVAFLVLLWATGNLVMAVYATVSIAGIVSIVLGWCKIVMGWDLGIAESIAGIIVIGMSVDYVVHLGHMYVSVHSNERQQGKSKIICALRFAHMPPPPTHTHIHTYTLHRPKRQNSTWRPERRGSNSLRRRWERPFLPGR